MTRPYRLSSHTSPLRIDLCKTSVSVLLVELKVHMKSHLLPSFALGMGFIAVALNCLFSFAQDSPSKATSIDKAQTAKSKNPYQVSFADFDWQLKDSIPLFDGMVEIEERMPTQKAIDLFLSRVQKGPSDYASRSILGELYLRQATEEDNLPSYNLAKGVLQDALKINSNYKPAIVGMAKVLMAQHQFADALAILSKSIPAESQGPADLALIADCHLETGDLAKTQSTLERLTLMEDSPPIVARQARLAELSGDQPKALELLESALRVVELSSADPTEWHWYQWRLAGLNFDMGHLEKAQSLVQKVLDDDAIDERSKILLVKIQFAKGHSKDALGLLIDVVKSHPSPPALAMLGDLYDALGDSGNATKYWDHAEQLVREEALIAKVAHAREAAIFFADHDRNLNEALELIQIDSEQRQDLHSRDAHSWILYKSKRLQEAKAKCLSAIEHGAFDLSCLYHATKIHQSLGEDALAKTYLQKIIDVNPRFSIRYSADVANLQEMWNLSVSR